ncbi:MAG: alpha/beta hydrolase [Thermodesulfobacteriota bacterium]
MSANYDPIGSSGAANPVNIADTSIGYRLFGNGYPLLMIMGYGSTMNLWEPRLIDTLASRFRVIIFDNRGMGSSGAGTQAFSIEQFSEDTCGLMDALGIERAHVLGWSMGSLIAQELALRHPSKVNKLVLYAAHCDAGMFPPSPDLIRQLTDTTGTPEERGMRYIGALFSDPWLQNHGGRIGEIFFRPMGNIPEESVGRQAMAIDAWKGATDRLGGIRSPALLIAGTEDRLVVPQNARFLCDHMPDAKLALIENGGHGLMFQYPDLFCRKVLGFLGQS